jgi:hypothetical protein
MHERWTTRATARAIALVSVTLLTTALLSACSWRVTTGSAAISGTVTLPEGVDLGDNSVIDVSIHRPGEEETVAYTLADASGEFEIFDIPTGEYTMYVSVFDADIAPQWWGGATRAAEADTFQVIAGEGRSGMDVALMKGSTLSGTISLPKGSRGKLRHAWVSVWDASERLWKGDSEVTKSGEFAVSGLAAGEYKIEVSPPRGFAARQWWGGGSDWTAASTVEVEASTERTGLDVALTSGGSISGVVRGDAAKEYGASVYATLRAPDGEWEEGISWVEVSPDGSYTLRGLAPGNYAVRFMRPIRERPCGDADTVMVRLSSEAEPSCSLYWPDRPDAESADLVEVTEGETVTSISVDLDDAPKSTS